MSSQYLLVMMVDAYGLIIIISASTSCCELAIQAFVDHNDYSDRYSPTMLIMLLLLKSSSLCLAWSADDNSNMMITREVVD